MYSVVTTPPATNQHKYIVATSQRHSNHLNIVPGSEYPMPLIFMLLYLDVEIAILRQVSVVVNEPPLAQVEGAKPQIKGNALRDCIIFA